MIVPMLPGSCGETTAAPQGKLAGYKYNGFWRCMDTFKDKQHLEEMDSKGSAPWKVWKTGLDVGVPRTAAGAVSARA